MAKAFYQKADGVMLIFDLTDEGSFNTLHCWSKSISEVAKEGVIKFLIGNKLDLTEERIIEQDEAMKVASEYDMKYFETSAKHKTNVVEVFEEMINEAYEHSKSRSSKILDNLKTRSRSCC